MAQPAWLPRKGSSALRPSASLGERAAGVLEVIEDLTRQNNQGWPLVVEGLRDEAALRELGVTGQIIRLNQGDSILATVEKLALELPVGRRQAEGQKPDERPVEGDSVKGFIIMVDWDRTGGQLARRLREAAKACGLKADSEHRKRLAYWSSSQTRCVEDLASFVARGLESTR